jgi:hypothetical protein
MKTFFCLTLAVGALLASVPSQALVESRANCIAACDGNGTTGTSCSWASGKRARFNRCRAKLIKQCRRFGGLSTCPLPVSPVTTTTTTTLFRPTTTVPVVIYPDLRGSYVFSGISTSDPCGAFGIGVAYSLPFSVTSQSGASLSGTMGVGVHPATGTYTPATGGWIFKTGAFYDPPSGCYDDIVISVDSTGNASLVLGNVCGTPTECLAQFSGTVN